MPAFASAANILDEFTHVSAVSTDNSHIQYSATEMKIQSNEKSFVLTVDDDKNEVEDEDYISVEQIQELELLCARNVFIDRFDFQKCPTCESILYRQKTTMSKMKCRTMCPLCFSSNENAVIFEGKNTTVFVKSKVLRNKRKHKTLNEERIKGRYFCWACAQAWKSSGNSQLHCGNHNCGVSFMQQTITVLRECGTKRIGSVMSVPEIRACPKCSMLITHVTACKHINCSQCHTRFCFVCMKKFNVKQQRWKCGSYSSVCPIASRQGMKSLPTANRTISHLF